jgi:4-aminobutyrate aminotransferase
MLTREAVQSDLPHLVTAPPGPKARAVIARDHAVLSPSLTRAYPLVVARGEGAIIEDADGNRFLDFNAGIAVAATGHCHPQVVRAIQEQAGRLIHMAGTDFYYESMPALAERLAASAPGGVPRRVFFGNSGAEAVEGAMKLARYHTGRDKFIAFLGAFHGRTMGSLSLTASKTVQRRKFSPLIPGVTHVPYPDVYRSGQSPEEATEACLAHIERLFETILPPEEVAAIFVEPVQGEGGYLVAPPGFLTALQALARKHGILIVADEVQCGMGRTGRMWASSHFEGFAPDILTSAKGIASGMPLSAIIARADVMQWTPGAHGSTFGGNPVAIAAALATLDLLESGLIANAEAIGRHILARLAEWPLRFPNAGDVRGLGLMIGIEFVRDQTSRERAPEIRDQVERLAFERGVLVLGAGKNTIRLCPPLIVTRRQADFAIDTLEECLKLAQRG